MPTGSWRAIFAGGAGNRHQSAEGGDGLGGPVICVAGIAPLAQDLAALTAGTAGTRPTPSCWGGQPGAQPPVAA